jgi:Ca2+-binding RTX toxin-like protein
MTTHATAGIWYETDPVTGAVTAWGESRLDWVVRDGTPGYTWTYGADPGDGSPPPVAFDPPFVNTRIDGEVRDGTSGTIFISEFQDGSVRFVSTLLEVREPATGRTYLYPLGGDPLPPFETAGELGQILDGTSNTIAFGETDPLRPGQLIEFADGTSNTFLLGENDELTGDQGVQAYWGGLGRDTIEGRAGDDTLYGEAGADSLDGGLDDDNLFGGLGNDLLEGGSGNDRVFAADGQDTVNGGGGHDALSGGRGADLVRGKGGNDLIEGGDGNDSLFGGAGGDVFVFRTGAGADRIQDFGPGDKLAPDAALTGTAATGAEVVATFGIAFDGDVFLTFADGAQVLVTDILAADLALAIEII